MTDLTDRIEHDFTNHAPIDPKVVGHFESLRVYAKAFAFTVAGEVPTSREQSLAITSIEQALMYAVAGIARNQERAMDQWSELEKRAATYSVSHEPDCSARRSDVPCDCQKPPQPTDLGPKTKGIDIRATSKGENWS
jgi:hypothetical protein